MLRRRNDILWKGILEGVFDDLLRFLFKDSGKLFDFQRGFEYLDKELTEMYPQPDKKSDTKFVDKLVKGFLVDGTEEWVLIHVEVQGAHDPDFAERMFSYYCRIYDRNKRPITGIAIFTGKEGRRMPDRYERNCLGSELTYRYNAIYLADYNDEELMKDKNPFALVLLAAKMALGEGKLDDEVLLAQKKMIVRLLYERNVKKEKITSILIFLDNYIRFADSKKHLIFKQEVEIFSKNVKPMGIVEQVAEMMAEEMAGPIAKKMARPIAEKMAVPIAEEMAVPIAERMAGPIAERMAGPIAEKMAEEKVEEERRQLVRNLLANTRLSVEKIALVANFSKEVVLEEKAARQGGRLS